MIGNDEIATLKPRLLVLHFPNTSDPATSTIVQQVKAGRLRALAHWGGNGAAKLVGWDEAAGALLIETLFSLDGLGLLSYESVIRRDYPVVLGTLYLFTLIGLVTKLVSDLCYVWVDPRVKFD